MQQLQSAERRSQRGFTLPEMLVVMVVVGVMLGVAVPAYRDVIARNRITARMNELVGAMQLARSESVRRGIDVSLCAVETGAKCGLGTSGSWATGWAIIAENAGGTDGTQDAADEVVSRNDVEMEGLSYYSAAKAAAVKAITFRPSGATRLAPGASFSLVICSGSDHGGRLTVDATGRPRATTLSGSDLATQCGA